MNEISLESEVRITDGKHECHGFTGIVREISPGESVWYIVEIVGRGFFGLDETEIELK